MNIEACETAVIGLQLLVFGTKGPHRLCLRSLAKETPFFESMKGVKMLSLAANT